MWSFYARLWDSRTTVDGSLTGPTYVSVGVHPYADFVRVTLYAIVSP